MKKQNIVVFVTSLVMMLSCVALSFGQLTTDNTELNEYKNQYEKIIDIGFIGEDIKSFGPALESGNLKAVKYLIETYPGLNLLNTPIKDENGKKEQPICIVSAKGYNNLVNYILDKEPKLVEQECYDDETGKQPLWEAITNGHADTALLLLSNNATAKDITKDYWRSCGRPVLLIETAKKFKDEETLKKLIPALLDAGASASTTMSEGCATTGDTLYWGAHLGNIPFVNILVEEMKKRGQECKSNFDIWMCDPREWGDLKGDAANEEIAWYTKKLQKEIELLKNNGVNLRIGVLLASWEECI